MWLFTGLCWHMWLFIGLFWHMWLQIGALQSAPAACVCCFPYGPALSYYRNPPPKIPPLAAWSAAMRWLRFVGALKLQVSFAKEPYKRDCILQNTTLSRLISTLLTLKSRRYWSSWGQHFRRGVSVIDQRRSVQDMGWLRPVGSLKWQVSIAKEPSKRDLCSAYSAKETYNFKEPTIRSHPIPQTHAAFSDLSASLAAMGWLRLVGSLKLQVSFAKEPYKKELYSAKETYNFKEPTNRSNPIAPCPLLHCFLSNISKKNSPKESTP